MGVSHGFPSGILLKVWVCFLHILQGFPSVFLLKGLVGFRRSGAWYSPLTGIETFGVEPVRLSAAVERSSRESYARGLQAMSTSGCFLVVLVLHIPHPLA